MTFRIQLELEEDIEELYRMAIIAGFGRNRDDMAKKATEANKKESIRGYIVELIERDLQRSKDRLK